MRLAGGNATFGRVEICADGLFGTVCDDEWDELDALVVCNQIGFIDLGNYNISLLLFFSTTPYYCLSDLTTVLRTKCVMKLLLILKALKCKSKLHTIVVVFLSFFGVQLEFQCCNLAEE